VNDFGFEQAVERFSQRIVIGIPDAADRWRDFGFGQPFGVFDL